MKNTMRITETWRDIAGFEGYYQISSLGGVKSLARTILTANGQERKIPEKTLKQTLSGGGYYMVSLNQSGVCKVRTVHSLVAETFLGHVSGGYKVVCDHRNRVKTDNRACNLQLVSQRENTSRRQDGASNFVGVSLHKPSNKWRAQIFIEGRVYNLGYFTDEIDAANRYQEVLSDIEAFIATKNQLNKAA